MGSGIFQNQNRRRFRMGVLLGAAALMLGVVPAGAIGGTEAPAAGGAGERVHAMSADGSIRLAIDDADRLVSVTAGGETSVLVDGAVQEAALSGDGSVAVVIDGDGDLRQFVGGVERPISTGLTGPISNLVLSGNGRYAAMAAPPTVGAGLVTYRMDLTGGPLLVVPGDTGATTRPIDLSDDGRHLLVWRGSDALVGQLAVFDVDALTITKVTVAPVSVIDAALAPDGSAVVFASDAQLVDGASTGVHVYETDLTDRLIRLVPLEFEVRDSVEISPSGQVVAQRSAGDSRAIEVIDRRTGVRSTQRVPNVASGLRVTPVEISDDDTALLVDIERCIGSVCTVSGDAVVVATGTADPLALRWSEADRPLFDSIDRVYQAVYGRSADAAGHDFWVGRLIAGDSLDVVADSLLRSTEGRQRIGDQPTSERVVEQAFSGIHGRSPSAAEVASLLAAAGSTPTDARLVVVVAQSPGAVIASDTSDVQSSASGQLVRLYRAVFGRFPDQAGYRYWAGQQAAGLSTDAMIDAFAESREFSLRYGSEFESDVAIALLYQNVLGRSPDAAGAAYWREQVGAGLGRNGLLASFVDSTENILRTGTQP